MNNSNYLLLIYCVMSYHFLHAKDKQELYNKIKNFTPPQAMHQLSSKINMHEFKQKIILQGFKRANAEHKAAGENHEDKRASKQKASVSIEKQTYNNTNLYDINLASPSRIKSLEDTTYNMLQAKPLLQDITILRVPWDRLIVEEHLPLMDAIKPTWEGTTITVCMYEWPCAIVSLLQKLKVTHLFVPQAPQEKKWKNMHILPIPYYPMGKTAPAVHKDLLYSFMGCATHPLRTELFTMQFPPDTHIQERHDWAGFYGLDGPWGAEYKDVLSRSRFGLCPRGGSPNTIRLFELMGAGAVPIILADDLCLPAQIDWSKYAIFIKESSLATIDEIIRAIPIEQEATIRAECFKLYKQFMDDPALFIRLALHEPALSPEEIDTTVS